MTGTVIVVPQYGDREAGGEHRGAAEEPASVPEPNTEAERQPGHPTAADSPDPARPAGRAAGDREN